MTFLDIISGTFCPKLNFYDAVMSDCPSWPVPAHRRGQGQQAADRKGNNYRCSRYARNCACCTHSSIVLLTDLLPAAPAGVGGEVIQELLKDCNFV